ncbi:hypothetical protein JW949_04110 [Candidatus Woesearchaeota archaeon]|nr:hypothetical protein [Candidatus Woesearchaeota archaeon]
MPLEKNIKYCEHLILKYQEKEKNSSDEKYLTEKCNRPAPYNCVECKKHFCSIHIIPEEKTGDLYCPEHHPKRIKELKIIKK